LLMSLPSLGLVNVLPKPSQFSCQALVYRLTMLGDIHVKTILHTLIIGFTVVAWTYVARSRLSGEHILVAPIPNDQRYLLEHCTVCSSKRWCRDGGRSKAFIKNDACVVCILDFQETDAIRVLCCGHAFHSECIKGWFQLKVRKGSCPTCPICRASVCLDEWPLGSPIEGPRTPSWISAS
jgi:hypothetical protein